MLHFLNKFEEILSSFFLAVMSVIIILQVIFRYGISYSLDWPEELARYLFIASVYIGSSYAEQEDRHLSVTILRTSGGAWCAKYLKTIASLVTIVFCGFMTVWGIQMTAFVYESNQVAPAMQFPMWVVYATLPFGLGCMGIRAAINLFKKGSPEPTLAQEQY